MTTVEHPSTTQVIPGVRWSGRYGDPIFHDINLYPLRYSTDMGAAIAQAVAIGGVVVYTETRSRHWNASVFPNFDAAWAWNDDQNCCGHLSGFIFNPFKRRPVDRGPGQAGYSHTVKA